jgi:hypothetical protein
MVHSNIIHFKCDDDSKNGSSLFALIENIWVGLPGELGLKLRLQLPLLQKPSVIANAGG